MSAPWQSGESPYQVTARDSGLVERLPAAGYSRMKLRPRFNDVGSWLLELHEGHPAVDLLMQDDSGIVVRPTGSSSVICSGFVRAAYRTLGGDGGLTVEGVTDDVVIAGEQAFPDPATDVSTSSTTTGLGWDVRTGAAEDVLLAYLGANIGPSAGITRRQYPWLNLPTSQSRGVSETWRARFTPLLELAQKICTSGGLGFRVVQGAPGTLDVQVYEPVDRPRARFSVEAGNLTSAVVTLIAPNTDDIVLGGSGEGTSRVFTRRTQANRVYRQSRFLDQVHTDQHTELRRAGDEILTEGQAKAGIQLYPVDQPGLRFGVHYQLGDLVRAYNIHDRVQQVVISHEPGLPVRVVPSVGVPDQTETTQLVDVARRLLRTVTETIRR